MHILKADTGVDVRIGPAVDATDGVTPETTLALGTADQAELLKHDGAATVDISGRTFAAVTNCDGWYDLTLTTSDTDTEGMVTVVIQDSSLCLPIFKDFMVVNANVYDSLYAAATTDYLQVDLLQIVANASAAINLRQGALGSVTLTVSTSSSTTSVTSDLSETTVDHYAGRVIVFLTGNLAGQASDITAYDGSGTMTVTALTEAPSNGDTAIIV